MSDQTPLASGRTRTSAWSADRGRLGALDGLRSLILVVLFVHFTYRAGSQLFSGWFLSLFTGAFFIGATSIDIFFVLSGFLITGILLDTTHSGTYFRTFYLRRFVRIVPIYYLFLFLFLIVLPRVATWDTTPLQLTPLEQASYWGYFVNIARVHDWKLAPHTEHLWTLSIEEQFYLLWPIVVRLCSASRLKVVCIGCIAVAPVARWGVLLMFPDTLGFFTHTLTRFDGLAFGSLIAVFWRDQTGMPRFIATVRAMGLVAAAIMVTSLAFKIVSSSEFELGNLNDIVYVTASVYFAALVVLATLQADGQGRWRRLLGSWPLRTVGTYSYAIYILHEPMSYALDRSGLYRLPIGLGISDVFRYCLVMTCLSLAVGAASWHFFEKPILRLRPSSAPRHTAIPPRANPR